MHFSDGKALAREYRRRGWKHIADFLDFSEESIEDIQALMYTDVDGIRSEEPIVISDPFLFFSEVLRQMERYGSLANAAVCLIDQFCHGLLESWNDPPETMH